MTQLGRLIDLDSYQIRKLRRKLRWAVRFGVILLGRFRGQPAVSAILTTEKR